MNALTRRLRDYRKPERLDKLHRALAVQWQRLAPRERRLVSLAATVVAAAAVWLLLLEPALKTVTRLQATLPALRAQAAQVDVIIAEAQGLSREAGIGATLAPSTAALTDSLRRAGLIDTATLDALDSRTWEVGFAQTPMEPILLWLRDLPFELRLRATRADLGRSAGDDGKPVAGLVSGAVTLSAEELPR